MHIVSRKKLREFGRIERAAEPLLDGWYRTAKRARWRNIAEVREIYPHADIIGKCVVFNIGGNKYRLIVKFEFLKQTAYIKFVLTHKEYDKNKWKTDC